MCVCVREREFLDFNVLSTAQGHLRTRETQTDRQTETERGRGPFYTEPLPIILFWSQKEKERERDRGPFLYGAITVHPFLVSDR